MPKKNITPQSSKDEDKIVPTKKETKKTKME